MLGKQFELDLIFSSGFFMKKLNKTYRKKDKSTNVLSFGLDKMRGEIVFDIQLIKKEAPKRGLTFKQWLWKLYLHALLHLKGHRHGTVMSKKETKLIESFNI